MGAAHSAGLDFYPGDPPARQLGRDVHLTAALVGAEVIEPGGSSRL